MRNTFFVFKNTTIRMAPMIKHSISKMAGMTEPTTMPATAAEERSSLDDTTDSQ